MNNKTSSSGSATPKVLLWVGGVFLILLGVGYYLQGIQESTKREELAKQEVLRQAQQQETERKRQIAEANRLAAAEKAAQEQRRADEAYRADEPNRLAAAEKAAQEQRRVDEANRLAAAELAVQEQRRVNRECEPMPEFPGWCKDPRSGGRIPRKFLEDNPRYVCCGEVGKRNQ